LFQDDDESISSSNSSAKTGGGMSTAVRGKASLKQLVKSECTPKLRLSADGQTLMSEFSSGKTFAGQITSTSSTSEQQEGDGGDYDCGSSFPSDITMSTRLEAALNPVFTPFQEIFRRGKFGKKTEAEFWVGSVQKRLQKHLLARCRFETATKRPSKIYFVTVFNFKWNVAISCEEQCPGMLKATFGNLNGVAQTVLQLSAFSPSIDCDSAPASFKKAHPAHKSNWSRCEQSLEDELIKLIESFEIDPDVSVAAVYKSPGKSSVGAASSSSAEHSSTDSPHCYYQSRKFSAYPDAQFKSTFLQKLALYSSLGSQDYTLSVLGCTLMDRVSEGCFLVGLGCAGQKILLDVIRDLTYSGRECDISDVSWETLYELGLVSTSGRLERSQRRLQVQLSRGASTPSAGGGGGGELLEDDYENEDSFANEVDERGSFDDYSGVSSSSSCVSSSSSTVNHGLIEYSLHCLPFTILCVAEEDDGDGKKIRIYSMPQYSDSGMPTSSVPVLLQRADRAVDLGAPARCRCSFSGLGHSLLGGRNVPGCELNSCFHERLLDDPTSAKTLRAKPCIRPPSVLARSSYHVILSQQPSLVGDRADPHLHVFVFAAGAAGVDSHAVVTLTQGYLSCSKYT
jgi:hypothetical protein